MLKICTVYFDGIYTPEHVSRLYEGIKSNTTLPFEFICLSDTDVKADIILPYNHHSNIKLHWHKLKFFSPQYAYQKPGDDIIIMDIDQVITNNIDEILNYEVNDGELLTYNAWWDNKLKKNGGFYKFKSGTLNHVWDDFALNPEFWQTHYFDTGVVHHKYYGEQNYVYSKVKNIKTLPGEWVYKETNNFKEKLELEKMYCDKFKTDYAIMGDVNKYIKVIHNAGVGKKTDG